MEKNEKVVGIHLDLKYLAPRFDYLLNWAKRLPEFGINTLLLEYEDKFPYVKYPFLKVPEAFSPDELKLFLKTLRNGGVRVIPLIQTLSHLEFALGHAELAHLREREDIPTQICPSNPDAIAFVSDLIDEVLEYHEEDEWVHLGADEAWALGTCPKCAEAVGDSPLKYRMKHCEIFYEQVRKKGKRPMIFDDMFWRDPEMVDELPDDVILNYWNYGITKTSPKFSSRIEGYKKSGKDVITSPCINWGIFFPRPETLDNTKAHTDIFHDSGTLGVINTAWTCFLMPMPAFQSRLAATADPMADASLNLSLEWERNFWEKELGADCAGVPEALRNLGELWEVPVEGLGRPLTPMIFGCMDMILHYPDGQDERMRRGQFPINFDDLDFSELHGKKVALLKKCPESTGLRDKLNAYLATYPKNAERLERLAAEATRQKGTASLLAALARLKALSARIFDISMDDGRSPFGDAPATAGELETEMLECRSKLSESLSMFYKDASVERLLRIIWEPQMKSLRA